MAATLRRTLLLSIVFPLVAIQVLLHVGVPSTATLAFAALFPLVEIALETLQTKRLGIIAGVSLAGMATGFALTFITGNGIFAVLKDSAFTFVFGAIFIGSLWSARPLIYRLNLEMGGRSAAERARNVEMWNVPAARRVFRIMTLVWGVGLMLEAVSRVVVTLNLPLTTATAISPFLSIGALGGLALWTFGYARWARRRRAIATANAA
jgi:hypothetical protein